MDERGKDREALIAGLMADASSVPTAAVGRLGRTALAMLRIRRAALASGGSDGDSEAIAAIVSSLGRLKGVSMKVGQILSYIDVALPEDLRSALAVLQTHAQPMPIEKVRDVVRSELPERAEDLPRHLDSTPVSAASIGQVHRSRLPDGTPVAVKVQYPGVEAAIQNDFRPAAFGAVIASMVYPGAQIEDLIEEAQQRFLEECDYRHEAEAQQKFVSLYEHDPNLVVPRVHAAYSSRRVLTSAWVSGSSFDAFLASDPPQQARDEIGETLLRFYVGSLFKHGIYNCDPHPGNYLFLDGHRIAMLDYGCTREFPPSFAAKLARLTLAVHADDRRQLRDAFEDLGMVSRDGPYDFEVARGLMRAFYGPMLIDATQPIELEQAMSMREVLTKKRELMKLTLPGEFLFLFRIRFGLMSVLAALGASANWYQLERGWAEAAAT